MKTRVLVIEDDTSTLVAIREGLSFEGYDVTLATDGEEGLRRAAADSPDLVVLDLMLPKLSGVDVCRELRRRGQNTPIIMLTARQQEIDKVLGLKSGADDYVTKPFSFMELLARIEAVLRRSGKAASAIRHYSFGNVTVDFEAFTATRNGAPVDLSHREVKLIEYFVRHRLQVVTRDQLLDAVWGYDRTSVSRTVDMHIAKLRKKIESTPDQPKFLLTVHGAGYKFVG